MLKQRVMTSLFLMTVTITCIFMLSLKALEFAVTIIFFAAAYEWAGLITLKLLQRVVLVILLSIFWEAGLSFFPLGASASHVRTLPMLTLTGGFWIIALLSVIKYPTSTRLLRYRSAMKFIAGIFVLFPFGWSILTLRTIDPVRPWVGAGWLVYVLVLVWTTDTGAYFSGRAFGRTKLAVRVSQKKTVEGLIGGILSAMFVCIAVSMLAKPTTKSHAIMVICSLITVLASVLGDLFESILKREAGVKDSGNSLPGHGGILDRIDSLSAGLPIFTLCYLLWIHV